MNKLDLKLVKGFFLVTDIGMIVYWTITYFKMIPAEYLFKDYLNPLVISWNWSFLPLDLLIPLTGLTSLYLMKANRIKWEKFALISLAFTSASGLQSISEPTGARKKRFTLFSNPVIANRRRARRSKLFP